MKKNHKRYHNYLNNGQVASVYVSEVLLNKPFTFNDGTQSITTSYYDYKGICVGHTKRQNNDWWNDDKTSKVLENKSTGKSIEGLIAITDTLTIHVLEFIKTYGYYCVMFEPTDKKRRITYTRFIKHLCKEVGLTYKYVIADDDTLVYWING